MMPTKAIAVALLALTAGSPADAKSKKGKKGKKGKRLVAHIAPYPESSGYDGIEGVVAMTFHTGTIAIDLSLEGAESDCSTTNTALNGCGVHIHEGLTCNSAGMIGGHFWKPAAFHDDPWKEIRYTSNAAGKVHEHIEMEHGNGYGKDVNLARAVVIHKADGGRIGCGLLEP